MCFYLTINNITVAGWMQHKLFFTKCNYTNNYTYFMDVLNHAVVPEDPQCRFHKEVINLTVANTIALQDVFNLTAVLERCTFSFHSLWT